MTVCFACGDPLVADLGAPDDPVTYQFENALWLGFHGGYGMFVDNLDATLPINTADRWLRDDGEYAVTLDGRPIDNPDWQPEFREERMLRGADYEAVICHDCAHKLCVDVPWIEKLIRSYGSHAHRSEYIDAHPDHYGWDYDPKILDSDPE